MASRADIATIFSVTVHEVTKWTRQGCPFTLNIRNEKVFDVVAVTEWRNKKAKAVFELNGDFNYKPKEELPAPEEDTDISLVKESSQEIENILIRQLDLANGLEPKDRKAWIEAEVKLRELLKLDGTLIIRADLERQLALAFSMFAQAMRSVTDTVERKLGKSPILDEIEVIINTELRNLGEAFKRL